MDSKMEKAERISKCVEACAEELLAMDMNICFTDVVPVKGAQFAGPHAGLNS